MALFDIVLLIALGVFVLYGFVAGLIHALGTLVGVVAGAFIAGRLFEPVAATLGPLFGGNGNLARVVVFLVLFALADRVVGLVFSLLERLFKILTIIPFLSTINRLAGAIFGLLEGTLVLGGGLYLAVRFPLGGGFTNALAHSTIAPIVLAIASMIIPLLPQLVRELQSVTAK